MPLSSNRCAKEVVSSKAGLCWYEATQNKSQRGIQKYKFPAMSINISFFSSCRVTTQAGSCGCPRVQPPDHVFIKSVFALIMMSMTYTVTSE